MLRLDEAARPGRGRGLRARHRVDWFISYLEAAEWAWRLRPSEVDADSGPRPGNPFWFRLMYRTALVVDRCLDDLPPAAEAATLAALDGAARDELAAITGGWGWPRRWMSIPAVTAEVARYGFFSGNRVRARWGVPERRRFVETVLEFGDGRGAQVWREDLRERFKHKDLVTAADERDLDRQHGMLPLYAA